MSGVSLKALWICCLSALLIPIFGLAADTKADTPELPKLPSEIWQTLLHGGRGDIILEAEQANQNPPPAE